MTAIEIEQTRLAKLDELVLRCGSHTKEQAETEQRMCAMEAVAWLAGERHSDSPECTCLVIAALVRRFNDRLRTDEERTALIRPLIPTLIGTRSTREVVFQRGYMVADWAVRMTLPIICRALQWEAQADECEALPAVVDRASALRARLVAQAVRKHALAAAYAAADVADYAADAADYAADAAAAAACASAASAAALAAAAASAAADAADDADATAAYAAADVADYAAAADAAAAAAAAAAACASAASAAALAAAAASAAADAADAADATAAYAAADAADYAADAAAAYGRKRLAGVRVRINASLVDLIKNMCAATK